ncbi:hypothetical protein LAY57_04240 [Argonema antarcticum A004/B2]|nr:hypothetical protein [Argonema antarcticum A004/B2]
MSAARTFTAACSPYEVHARNPVSMYLTDPKGAVGEAEPPVSALNLVPFIYSLGRQALFV